MKRIVILAMMVSTLGMTVTGCGGVNPAPTKATSVPEVAVEASPAPSQAAENTPATQEVSQPEITRGQGWTSKITGSWPLALNAGKDAQFDGLLTGYDRNQAKWKPFSGYVTITLKDKNGIDVYHENPKLSGGDGKFSFRVRIPGKKGDYCRAILEFVGNSQFKPDTDYRNYTLK